MIRMEREVTRSLTSAWIMLFESANEGHMKTLAINSTGLENLGLALHTFQDVSAHQGAVFRGSKRTFFGLFSIFGNEHDLHNDSKPNEAMFNNAMAMTKNAIIVHQTLTGDYSNLSNGLVIKTSGMLNDQDLIENTTSCEVSILDVSATVLPFVKVDFAIVGTLEGGSNKPPYNPNPTHAQPVDNTSTPKVIPIH